MDADAWAFPGKDGLLPPCSLRHPMERALRLAGIHKRLNEAAARQGAEPQSAAPPGSRGRVVSTARSSLAPLGKR